MSWASAPEMSWTWCPKEKMAGGWWNGMENKDLFLGPTLKDYEEMMIVCFIKETRADLDLTAKQNLCTRPLQTLHHLRKGSLGHLHPDLGAGWPTKGNRSLIQWERFVKNTIMRPLIGMMNTEAGISIHLQWEGKQCRWRLGNTYCLVCTKERTLLLRALTWDSFL